MECDGFIVLGPCLPQAGYHTHTYKVFKTLQDRLGRAFASRNQRCAPTIAQSLTQSIN
jgi:hypothetical protein